MCIIFAKLGFRKAHAAVAANQVADVHQSGDPDLSINKSDGFAQSGIGILSPPQQPKLRVATPSIIYERRQLIQHNIERGSLPLGQGGGWKEESQAVKACSTQMGSDNVSLQIAKNGEV